MLSNEAQTGFAAAAAYDAGRPAYAPEVVDQLLQNLALTGKRHAKVLDLAAGTGKFTEALSSRPEQFDIVAIEPHDDMRKHLSQKSLNGVTVVKGTAEHMDGVADATFDAVIAAQSFHWFATMDALEEIARVLKPGRCLGMIWNIDDYNAPRSWDTHPGWDSEMRQVVWGFRDDQPRFRHEQWKAIFDEQNASNPLTLHLADPLFGLPIGEDTVAYKVWLSPEACWSRIRTLSQIAVLKGTELDDVKRKFEESLKMEGTEIDGENIALHGRTYLAWTPRIPEAPLRSGG